VSSPRSIKDAAQAANALLPDGLDHLVSNAGVNPQPLASFENLSTDEFIEEIRFNTVYTINLLRAFLPLIRKGNDKSIAVMSSQLGSIQIGAMLPGLANAYSVSKASLNMLARKWSAELKPEGITVFMLHPGWVETDIGDAIEPWIAKYNPDMKKMTTQASAVDCVKLFGSVGIEDAGVLFNHDGSKIPF
jgi:NAD(P)-dependent dehydrogenase (short-subunit alcohol dehydrogenase family)